MISQGEKRERGIEFQSLWFQSLMTMGYGWHLRLRDGASENPFDYLSSVGPWLIGQELKRTASDRVSLTMLRKAQLNGLGAFVRANKQKHIPLVVVWFDCPEMGVDQVYLVDYGKWVQHCATVGQKSTTIGTMASIGHVVPIHRELKDAATDRHLWDLRDVWPFALRK